MDNFLEFFLSIFRKILFSSHWLLSHIPIVETIDNAERGMNPVTMTIFNSRGSNQRPAVLKSCKLPTEPQWFELLVYNENMEYK